MTPDSSVFRKCGRMPIEMGEDEEALAILVPEAHENL